MIPPRAHKITIDIHSPRGPVTLTCEAIGGANDGNRRTTRLTIPDAQQLIDTVATIMENDRAHRSDR